MKSSEEVLEATVWACMTTYEVTAKSPAEFVQMLIAAAKAYAAGDTDALTETRRLLLSEATQGRRLLDVVDKVIDANRKAAKA